MKLTNGITFIGSGNLAWHLAASFNFAGVKINSVVSRNSKNAQELAEFVGAKYASFPETIPSQTDIIFICVSDSAVAEVANIIRAKNYGIPMVHASGSLPIEVLGGKDIPKGVFYPLQSFSKNVRTGKLDFPICIEAEDQDLYNILLFLGRQISKRIVSLSSEKRLHLHLAGVMANNFTNHILAKTFEYLESQNIEPDLLNNIIEETANKAISNKPYRVQTGPAVRGSTEIIKKHLALLKEDENLLAIYQTITKSISTFYSDKKHEF